MTNITTSQTIGPFSHEAWQWAADASAAGTLQTSAPTITISGTIYDGDGTPINDAQIEAWQPAAASAEAAQALPGFRRVPSGEKGEFSLRLSQPAAPTSGEPATFITVFARGLVKHQFTAVFLEDDSGLAQSAILAQVPEQRRPTLIARKTAAGVYHWDIWMQTDKETAFFDYV
ncbi:protocatechuate 3,4-dioxygenase [Duganella sp. FT50W]|uniref:Protocatechuate 3,4-dioxygenase n=1 Tax=Duganella lactea TaxID=2692173 RepID=A0A6L8MH91_9BURK|nr:protocatechuate 3,4-dioxygenase [Duganella lactea]MYM81829.1 protocatechuate 3,4-dioxygenase [Duganella lactea]